MSHMYYIKHTKKCYYKNMTGEILLYEWWLESYAKKRKSVSLQNLIIYNTSKVALN